MEVMQGAAKDLRLEQIFRSVTLNKQNYYRIVFLKYVHVEWHSRHPVYLTFWSNFAKKKR